MKVYLDDERKTPEGWARVYWPEEAIELLRAGGVSDISLDHDLGNDDRGTGYDVVLWIEEQVVLHGFVPPAKRVHSANVSARTKMENGIRAIEVLVRRRDELARQNQRVLQIRYEIAESLGRCALEAIDRGEYLTERPRYQPSPQPRRRG